MNVSLPPNATLMGPSAMKGWTPDLIEPGVNRKAHRALRGPRLATGPRLSALVPFFRSSKQALSRFHAGRGLL